MRSRQHEAEPPLHQLRPDAFIIVLISLILQGWTVATAARMFDLDAPPLQQASRLDIDLPGRLGDENTVAGYRVEARCRAASKAVEALPLPPTASVLVVIRDGIARSAASAPPLAPGDYVLALARPKDLALLDRVFLSYFALAAWVASRAPRCTEPAAGGPRVRILLPPEAQRRVRRELNSAASATA
jgi:NhaP-type Na+/H+ and K+/H+ antiporter